MIVRIRAFAKINLTLHVMGLRADGYHWLRTTFQSIAVDDALTFATTGGPFEVFCDDPDCPAGSDNIVWKAAARLWEAAGRSGTLRGVRVRIEKRIPMAAGLGGGSADAAAALRALAPLWGIKRGEQILHDAAAAVGADVPFFLHGGTALGVNRGDVLIPLPDIDRRWVVVAVPRFGVSTSDAYGWFDATLKGSHHTPGLEDVVRPFKGRLGNDLERPVIARHPEIGDLIGALESAGGHAAMSGSGSAVFGLFPTRLAAETAADSVIAGAAKAPIIYVARTLSRAEYKRLARPVLARK
jgi:4-diphosphocytidyl-2-C-methyl-D-erythritol kinase